MMMIMMLEYYVNLLVNVVTSVLIHSPRIITTLSFQADIYLLVVAVIYIYIYIWVQFVCDDGVVCWYG